KLGAHPLPERGTRFAVWAPNASAVAVMGDFNFWDASADALQPRGVSGIWEGRVASAQVGHVYKYAITTANGEVVHKADPFARCTEVPPRTGSVIWDLAYEWGDDEWMRSRGERMALSAPMAIYEV